MTHEQKKVMVDQLKYHLNQQEINLQQAANLRNQYRASLNSFLNSHSAQLMMSDHGDASYQKAMEEHQNFLQHHDENIAKHASFIDSMKFDKED